MMKLSFLFTPRKSNSKTISYLLEYIPKYVKQEIRCEMRTGNIKRLYNLGLLIVLTRKKPLRILASNFTMNSYISPEFEIPQYHKSNHLKTVFDKVETKNVNLLVFCY